MADPRESRGPREPSEVRHKKHRSRSRQHGSSDARRSTGQHSSRQTLSMDALAALNEANARGLNNTATTNIRASRDRDTEAEEELERRIRHERRERRRRESRARVDRDEYRQVEPDSPGRQRQHRHRRESRSHSSAPRVVAAAALAADDDVDAAGSDYHNERRQRRKDRSSRRYEATSRGYESAKGYESAPEAAYQDMMSASGEREREGRRHRGEHRRQKKASAAAFVPVPVEEVAKLQPKERESKGFWAHVRGGGTNTPTSYDSYYDKEDAAYDRPKKKFWTKRKIWVAAGLSLAVVVIIIVAAVIVSKKSSSSTSSSSTKCTNDLTCNLASINASSIPADAPDYLNPFTWYDTIDFNLTYTDTMVGDLPIMGLNSTWDDSAAPNDLVPALNEEWGSYASRPARGVSLGGWLSLEPFIAPDLFSSYSSSLGIIDEYTLCSYLGTAQCSSTLEAHYSSFVTESTFAEIADAGLDHIRIPYSYWAVQTYDDDPYLFRTSWRYLLRGIEWARKYGLRVNLDLHALPGSQNGWNHSGRQGAIGWFNGTNSTQNVQRSVDVHDRLSQFFAQPRYENIITHYGLANEPRMTFIAANEVINWTETVYAMVRANGLSNKTAVVFGDGFRGLDAWQGEMTGYDDGMVLDVHQYVIFNNEQIVYNHSEKVRYACEGWTEQTEQSMNTSTGFGPTMIAEWSQADTDCATYLNNVGWGNRWTGTYDTGNSSDPLEALTPRCPAEDSTCSCTSANADPSDYSDDYKQFLLYFAEAQMDSFEKGWGWWYWTWWTTESSAQWSYKRGLAAGILPAKAYDRSFHCNSTTIPDWYPDLPEIY